MCGIVGYIGNKDPVPILVKGLKRLEYRGYDSSGIALLEEDNLTHIKKAGKVSDLQQLVDYSSLKKELQAKGYKFRSQTDSEVIAHLLSYELKSSVAELAIKKTL